MQISKEITVIISPNELEEIIKDYLKNKGISTNIVIFDVRSHDQKGDFGSQLPPIITLDGVICKGVEH